MPTFFDEQKWESLISSRPDWYIEIYPELQQLLERKKTLPKPEGENLKEAVYTFFERNLSQGKIILGEKGEEWDSERVTLDTIVIHHTSKTPGLTVAELNAIHFVNLYVPHYAKPRYDAEEHIKGAPIYSGHFREGRQVFYAYHWIVRMDGSTQRLLEDNEIGWQAGNWDVNKKSVAICLDNDYTSTDPSEEVLEAIARLIKEHYPTISRENIIGHKEVNPKTECPGNTFLGGWKEGLTAML